MKHIRFSPSIWDFFFVQIKKVILVYVQRVQKPKGSNKQEER